MKLSTFFILVGLFIISLYALVEVIYYSEAQNASQHPGDTPYIIIPKIGVDESINNKSVDYGIYHEPESSKPWQGTTVLFGHRTLHGSPFLKLDQLQPGDNITLEWPGIGFAEYKVMNSTIVPASYRLSVEQGNTLFVITCYPLGSTQERLMIQAQPVNIYPIKTERKPNPQQPYALMIILAFLGGGSALSFFYPVKDDRVILFIATIALTVFLTLGYLFPTPPITIESYLSNLSNFFGV